MSGVLKIQETNSFIPTTIKEAPNKEKLNTWQKVEKFVSNRLNFNFIKTVILKSAQIGRRLLKAAVVKVKKFEPKMLKAIAFLGLLQLINIAESIYNYPSNIMSFMENLSLRDVEGMVLSGISLIMNPLDAMDSVITFCQSASALSIFPVVTAFSVIALPIALTMLGFASVKGIYDLISIGIVKHQIPSEVRTMNEIQKLKVDLEKKLRVTAAEKKEIEAKYAGKSEKIERKIKVLKTKKINALTRHTDVKIMNVMSNLLDRIEKDPPNDKQTNEALSDIHTLMNRKITVGAIGTIANIALLSTIIASTATTVAPLTIPLAALIRAAIFVGKEIYMSELYTKGLYAPEMTKAKI